MNSDTSDTSNITSTPLNEKGEEKVLYCELCDVVSPKLSCYMQHIRTSKHKNKCLEYRKEICSDKKQLDAMSKMLKDKMGLQFRDGNELVMSIIQLMTKQKLTSQQIKEARERIKKRNEEIKKSEEQIKETKVKKINQENCYTIVNNNSIDNLTNEPHNI